MPIGVLQTSFLLSLSCCRSKNVGSHSVNLSGRATQRTVGVWSTSWYHGATHILSNDRLQLYVLHQYTPPQREWVNKGQWVKNFHPFGDIYSSRSQISSQLCFVTFLGKRASPKAAGLMCQLVCDNLINWNYNLDYASPKPDIIWHDEVFIASLVLFAGWTLRDTEIHTHCPSFIFFLGQMRNK